MPARGPELLTSVSVCNSYVFFSGLLMEYFQCTNPLDFSLKSPIVEMPLQLYPSLAMWTEQYYVSTI